MIKGFATENETKQYFKRLNKEHASKRTTNDLFKGKFSLGTYMGDFSDEHSKMYRESIEYALLNGVNSIDTAVNYRGMRSERDLGNVLTRLIEKKKLKREEIIISTKGGIIPGDGEIMHRPIDYIEDYFLKPKLINPCDYHMYENLRLSMHPNYFDYVIDLSRKHMNIETIDIYYFHLPGLSYEILGKDAFYKRLKILFNHFENKVKDNIIKSYGLATWNCFIVDENHRQFISLNDLMEFVKENNFKNFQHIMLPVNLNMNEAYVRKNHNGKSFMDKVKEYALEVHSSASFNKFSDHKDWSIKDHIEFIDAVGVDDPIIGSKQIKHLKENMKAFGY